MRIAYFCWRLEAAAFHHLLAALRQREDEYGQA